MPLRDEHGKIIGTFGVSTDITKLKQTEKALRHAKDIAEAFGIAEQFEGSYQVSDQLVERRDWSMLGGLFLILAVLVGGVYRIMRRRQGN